MHRDMKCLGFDYDVDFLDTREQLVQLTSWVEDGQPFYHTRWNDGEVTSAFALTNERQSTSGEHHYDRYLGLEMKKTMEEIATYCTWAKEARVIVGSWWYMFPDWRIAGTLRKWLEEHHLAHRIPWATSDVWYSSELEVAGETAGPELLKLFDAIRGRKGNTVLVGSKKITDCSCCIDAVDYVVPESDCWDVDSKILEDIRGGIGEGVGKKPDHADTLFVWCCGIPAKVWSWRLWKEFPQSSHLDLGHVFNGACGDHNRDWLRKKDGPHWKFLTEKLIPYIDSFVPKG